MNRKDIESAITRELEEWPDVTVEFVEGGKHPRAKVIFEGLIESVTYSSTPSSQAAIPATLGDLRRALRKLGAARNCPEPSPDEERKAYSPPNEGRAKRPPPGERAPAKVQPTIAEKLTDVGVKKPAELDLIKWRRVDVETGEVTDGMGLISEPGVYEMDEETYHGDPCVQPSLSGSLIKKLLPGTAKGGSPMHMQYAHPRLTPRPPEDEPKKIFDLGSAFHTMILGEGQEIVIIEESGYQKKAAQQQRDDAYAMGMQPVLREQYIRAEEMYRAAQPQIFMRPELARAMAKGWPERTLIWIEETPHGPIYCRCKLDWQPADGDLFPDWKSTGASAGPDGYGRTMFDVGCDVQAAFYARGIKAVLNRDADFVFVCIETFPPYALCHHDIHPSSNAMGKRKVGYGINTFGLCLARGFWPGYPLDRATQSAPPWVENAWIDREDSGMTGIDFTKHMIDALADLEKTGKHTYDPGFAADFDLTPHGEGK